MERKPVILILTSTDEYGEVSARVAEAVRASGTHNAVVVDERRYNGRFLNSRPCGFMRGYMLSHPGLAEKLRGHKDREVKSGAKARGRILRIANAVKRYAPEFVLTTTAYALNAIADARVKAGVDCTVVHLVVSFTYDRHDFAPEAADWYIVENSDIKESLEAAGVPARRIMIMGLPFAVAKLSDDERRDKRAEKGLPETPTVFLNARADEKADELLGLLIDQGKIVNTVCYADSPRLMARLRNVAEASPLRNNVAIISRKEQCDEFLPLCDVIITRYDTSVVYKCMCLGKPVISFSDCDHGKRDLEYLREKGLVGYAKDTVDTVGLLYDLLQDSVRAEYTSKGIARTELYSVDNLANYLTSFRAE